MTPTGRATGRQLYGDLVDSAYLPYDYPFAVARFLRAWRPVIGIVMETELWPNLVAGARAAGIPLALVNARLSESSLRKGRRWEPLIRPALAGLTLVAAQSQADADRIASLGRPADAVTGNLKFDVLPPAVPRALGRAWRGVLGNRPVLLLASSREGEEELVLRAWRQRGPQPLPAGTTAVPAAGEPLLVIVPRHPQRFDDVAQACAAAGMTTLRRSQWDGETPPHAQVLLGDSMGEMFAYYGLADVAIIGGSLLPFGAQNLIEAGAMGVPVLLGPHTYNFAEAADQAVAAGAALRVGDATQAVAVAQQILADDERRNTMRRAAIEFTTLHRGALERTLQALAPLLRASPSIGSGSLSSIH